MSAEVKLDQLPSQNGGVDFAPMVASDLDCSLLSVMRVGIKRKRVIALGKTDEVCREVKDDRSLPGFPSKAVESALPKS